MRNALPVVAIVLSGCAHTYDLSRPTMSPPAAKLDPSASAYIAMPLDGTFEDRIEYRGSGAYTADVVQEAFRQHLRSVSVAKQHESYELALESAKASGAMYLVYPEILHWEDRATAWSGMSDRILLRVSIIDVQEARPIDSIEIAGKSRWFTLASDDPKDLLEVPINQYINSLF